MNSRFDFDLPPRARQRSRTLHHDRQRADMDVMQAAAEKLERYFRLRAEREPQMHGLSAAFFLAHLKTGHRGFYGVLVGESGALIEDAQRPATLVEFLRHESREVDQASERDPGPVVRESDDTPAAPYLLVDEADFLSRLVA